MPSRLKTWTISARAIDTGWNKYNLLVATAPGVLYARAACDGRLYRYRFDPATQRWVDRTGSSGSFSWVRQGSFLRRRRHAVRRPEQR